ncbi:MAG: DNA primase [Clostridia bacterium]|nr:DNA primase [Clostridia bacterium]
MIPSTIIEDLKLRCDIVDLVGSYVTLKRAGSNYSGLCPFHSEKTPSFVVFPSTQTFHCFGCGAGGDVISFVMRAENVDYPSALEFLANRCGVTLPQDRTDPQARGVSRKRIFEMNREAAQFFRAMLFDDAIGAEARRYLIDRGLTQPIIKHFGLGYSPNNFGMLRDHLASKGFTEEEMVEGFLCGKSQKTGRAFDYFRDRVMFPIIDVSGNVVAFGGRVMGDAQPKYLNTSDTPGFKKSRNLFALNYAKNHCEDSMILCEGYMDVIALHGAGFENAVATLGTAITSEQARIFAKYTKKVYISYDSDGAGQRAADKAFRMLGEVGVETKIISLIGAKDPDEYIKKFGKAAFARLLEGSKTRFEFEFDRIVAKYDITTTDGKIKAGADACRVLSEVRSQVERELYISRVAEKLGLSRESIKSDIASLLRRKNAEQKKNEMAEVYRASSGLADRVNPQAAANLRAAKTEETLLGLLMYREENIRAALRENLTEEDFVTDFNRRVYQRLMEIHGESQRFDLGRMNEFFTPDEMSRISKMIADRTKLSGNGEKELETTLAALRREADRSRKGEDVLDDIEAIIKRKKK